MPWGSSLFCSQNRTVIVCAEEQALQSSCSPGTAGQESSREGKAGRPQPQQLPWYPDALEFSERNTYTAYSPAWELQPTPTYPFVDRRAAAVSLMKSPAVHCGDHLFWLLLMKQFSLAGLPRWCWSDCPWWGFNNTLHIQLH